MHLEKLVSEKLDFHIFSQEVGNFICFLRRISNFKGKELLLSILLLEGLVPHKKHIVNCMKEFGLSLNQLSILC